MRWERLRQRIQQGRKAVRFDDLRQLLEAYGWELDRVRDSHHTFKKGSATLTVPHRRPHVLPVYVDQVLLVLPEGKDDDDADD